MRPFEIACGQDAREPPTRMSALQAMKKQSRKSIDRRTFVKVLPAAGAAVIAASQAPLSAFAQTASPTPSPSPAPTPGRIKKNDLEHAEKIIGIDLSDKHRDMALSGVNTNLDRYDA